MLFPEPITVVVKIIGQALVICPSQGTEVSPALPKPHDLGKVEGGSERTGTGWAALTYSEFKSEKHPPLADITPLFGLASGTETRFRFTHLLSQVPTY